MQCGNLILRLFTRYAQLASFVAIVLLPHVPNALRLADMMALQVPLFVPSEPFVYRLVWPLAGSYCGWSDASVPMMQRVCPSAAEVHVMDEGDGATVMDREASGESGGHSHRRRRVRADADIGELLWGELSSRRVADANTRREVESASRRVQEGSSAVSEGGTASSLHPFDIFNWQSSEAFYAHKFMHERRYWYQFSEWGERAGALMHFDTISDLYEMATSEAGTDAIADCHMRLRSEQESKLVQSLGWWRSAMRGGGISAGR